MSFVYVVNLPVTFIKIDAVNIEHNWRPIHMFAFAKTKTFLKTYRNDKNDFTKYIAKNV